MNISKKDWWKDAVVYQIYPKSFQDSKGDGIGDIKGITNRLEYIKDLGANVIWICPVYESPMDDNGYDISDYYSIDPIFGKNEDMEELIKKADKLGIKILMDLVINHTSDEHEWFKKALKDPNGKYADYYIFKEGVNGQPPNNWRSYFGGTAWEKIEGINRYYLHAFTKKQPDLNWENKEVREELYKMINYWLEKGIGGFRIDAICNIKKDYQEGIFKSDGEDGLCFIGNWILNQPGIEDFLTELSNRTFKVHNSMTVAEANVPEHLLNKFIGEDGFFSMVFDFSYTDIDVPDTGEWFKPTDWSIKMLRDNIFKSQLDVQKRGWGALYLENHDQPRSLNKYLPKEEINYYSKTMLASMFMLMRGTPFIYQGQEIGMTNIEMDSMNDYDDIATHDQYKRALQSGLSHEEAFNHMIRRSRDNSRTPMQWDKSKNAGFSDSDRVWLMVNQNYKEINVDDQLKDSKSVLSFYKKLINLRNKSIYSEVLINGVFNPFNIDNDYIIAYKRILGDNEVLVINSFSNKNIEILLDNKWKEKILSNYCDFKLENDKYMLRPYETVILSNY